MFDDDNEPFLPLIYFYHEHVNRISESSVIAYLHTLEPFFYWMKHNSRSKGRVVAWSDNLNDVQEAVRQYLIQVMHCKVRGRDNHEGIYLTNKSSKSVQLFLSALKNFYKTMNRMGMYAQGNPLTDLEFENNLSDRQGVRPNKTRVFQAAGTEESMEYRNQTDSYFKIINEEWIPEIIGDSDLPYRIYRAGQSQNWCLRDEVITRFMFETGARISEILELTMGDYRSRSDQHEFAATNKGSYKRRIKTLKLLIRYVNAELLDLFLPILHADFKISETYCHQEKKDKIACDITIINGRNDHSAIMYDMCEWRYYAGGAATFHTVDGGHFFITENYGPVVDIIKQTLTISDKILERQ
ncbi:thioesterase domain-containing protein [Paenibacillus sp. IHBB 10380]|uniref:thioesterase domain-containing protein n=1 Tax=Paenibacillus sp. IHBB 10380 TaxID=1566358 RepID=UPI001F4164D0|nr:thioesterase domain-containing protein [Paenibacillus sp. IHBB 10380]